MLNWLRGHWQLFAATVLVLVLWQTPLILPLKILVVMFHEMSHGLMAILTGGEIVSLSVSADQGGLAITRGGSRFLILTAGYLGSLAIGIALLLAGLWSAADKAVVALLGLVLLVIAALYVRDTFALIFCAATGVGLSAVAYFLPNTVSDLILRLIGLTSIIYVPRDIISDTIQRSHLPSDAYMLGAEFFGGAAFWGGIWLVISVGAILVSLRFCLNEASNLILSRKP